MLRFDQLCEKQFPASEWKCYSILNGKKPFPSHKQLTIVSKIKFTWVNKDAIFFLSGIASVESESHNSLISIQ